MKDKIGAVDRISFVMNGKPIGPAPQPVYCKEKLKPGGCQLHNLHCQYPVCDKPPNTWICPRCNVDRLKLPCPGPLQVCPMVAKAQ